MNRGRRATMLGGAAAALLAFVGVPGAGLAAAAAGGPSLRTQLRANVIAHLASRHRAEGITAFSVHVSRSAADPGIAVVVGEPKLTGPIVARGYVLLAATGLTRPGRTGRSWSFGVRPPLRDELAFVRQMLADAVPRFHPDRERVLVTGFSFGGSLAWYLACQAPGEFAAFAPVAGGFWRPHPTECAGRVWLLHIHGWRDRTVPPEGRPLRPELEQGDIFEGLQLWRRENGCTGLRADVFATDAAFWRRAWTAWAPGSALELALHPGDHEVPNGRADMAPVWFEAVVPASH